jgi:hypothetical protein
MTSATDTWPKGWVGLARGELVSARHGYHLAWLTRSLARASERVSQLQLRGLVGRPSPDALKNLALNRWSSIWRGG